MVLLSELGMLGGFAWTAWQVAGQWYRFRSKNVHRLDDAALFTALDQAIAAAKANDKAPRKEEYGAGAARSGHAHIFEDFKKLPLPLRTQFIDDLANLAQWSGQGKKALRKRGTRAWKSLRPSEKEALIGALDSVSFSFMEDIKEEGQQRAQCWLWQVNESLPLLSEEPLASAEPAAELQALQKRYETAESAVKSALDAHRSSALASAKEAVTPLAVAAAQRNMQVLRTLLEPLGLDPRSVESRLPALRSALEALSLEVGSEAVKKEVEKAEAALKAQVDSSVSAVRESRMASVEAAARGAYVAEIVRATTAADVWSAAVPLGRKLAVAEVVLAELASSSEGEAGVTELVAAARQVASGLLAPLGLSAAGEERSQAAAAHLETLAGSDAAAARTAAGQLRALLVAAAEPLLPRPPPPAGAASNRLYTSDTERVKELVGGMFQRISAAAAVGTASEAVDRNAVKKAIVEAANDKSAAGQQAAVDRLESELTSLAAETTSKVLAAKGAHAQELGVAERIMLVSHGLKALLSQPPLSPASAAEVLSTLTAEDQQALTPASRTALARASFLAQQLQLAAACRTGLDLGPGSAGVLQRCSTYLSSLEERSKRDAEEAAAAAAAGTKADGNAADGDAEGEEKAEKEEGKKDGDTAAAAPAPAPLAPSPLDASKVEKARALIAEQLAEGLVLLELQSSSYKQLQSLRETVDALDVRMDGMLWNSRVTLLKELVANLGPIGAAVDAKLSEIKDEGQRAQLTGLRESAVSIYRTLQQFIEQDSGARAGALHDMSAIRELVYASRIERKSSGLEGLLGHLTGIITRATAVTQALKQLPDTDDAISEIYVMEEQVEKVMPLVRSYAEYVRLREHALGAVAPVVPPGQEVEEMPTLQDTQHITKAVWQDLAGAEPEDIEGWREAGYKLIARGQAAVVLLAGAVDGDEVRCTRDAGLPSTKSLLQLLGERLIKIQQLAAEALYGEGSGVVSPLQWYIMTTPATLEPITRFLQDSGYFGLEASQVHVFACTVAPPLVNDEFKVVLETPYKLARGAAGSGELFPALRQSGMLDHMGRSGVRCLDVHAVEDNMLARVADPVFLGFCSSIELDCAAKVVERQAVEPLMQGYMALAAGGGAGGPEGEEQEELGPVTSAIPSLVPAIGVYYLSMRWLRQVDSALAAAPLSLYRLSPQAGVPAIKGARQPGYRLERRIADFIAQGIVEGQQSGVVVVEPHEEFSPVWGSPPFYAPETPTAAVEDLLLLHTSWVEAAGGSLPDDESALEVAPLVSYGGEGLEGLVEGRSFEEAYDLDLQGYAPQAERQSNVGPWFIPFVLAFGAAAAVKLTGAGK